MKVMLLEDDPSLRFALTQIIEAGGHHVNAAADITEAADLLGILSPDLILLDLMIGDEYSLQIADLAGYRAPDAKIIYLTGSNKFPKGELFALYPNTSWVLRKPIDFVDLGSILEHFEALVHGCAGKHLPTHHTSLDLNLNLDLDLDLDLDRDWLGGTDHAVQSGDLNRYFPFLGAECAGGQPSTVKVLDPSDACLRQ